MAHEIEVINGEASFVSFREPAWHGLGTVFTEEKTTSEMLEAANLNDWKVIRIRADSVTFLREDNTRSPPSRMIELV